MSRSVVRPKETWLLLAICATATLSDAATPFVHTWDTVSDVMGAHGKFRELPTDDQLDFAATHYQSFTTGTLCSSTVNTTHPIEGAVLPIAAKIKEKNPNIKMGMYWRSDFALEIAKCSGFSDQWHAHAAEFALRDDTGKPILHDDEYYYIDYSNPAAAAFFVDVLFNVSQAKIPVSDKPILDYIYIDGCPQTYKQVQYFPGINPTRSALLYRDIYATFSDLQFKLDAAGFNQKIVLNSMDSAGDAATHVSTGAAASMFDHWSILQFLDRDKNDGSFNVTAMDGGIDFATSSILHNVTVQVKGWPGPIVRQKDVYPPSMKSPTTPVEFQTIIKERFLNELALFLLLANEYDQWIYSWFWDFNDYVPGANTSTMPASFFPEAKCPLGKPNGPHKKVTKTLYTRDFEYASVMVDLANRTACTVTFKNCDI